MYMTAPPELLGGITDIHACRRANVGSQHISPPPTQTHTSSTAVFSLSPSLRLTTPTGIRRVVLLESASEVLGLSELVKTSPVPCACTVCWTYVAK